MIAEQWEHIKELFDTALNCSPQEKLSLLTRLAEEDPGVADQVRRLLASYEKAGDFLAEPCCPSRDFLEDLSAEQQRFFPGDVICGRFRIVSLLGRGGMGEVYKAWDEELEDHVALKTLRPDISTHELFTSRFRREMQLARKVTHPNVCRIFDSFKHSAGDGIYVSVLSMELLQGQTLGNYLKAKGRLSATEAMPLVQQIIAGLSAIHAAGVIHRDLKPANLILVAAPAAATDTAFQIKITDFGIAGRLPDGLSPGVQTEASKLLGTPDYMAPEQLEGASAGVQSDIYSLGLILFEIVTGAKPFAGASAWKRISSDAPSPRRLMRDLPENWNRAIVCCLERNPAYRFQSAQALLENLDDSGSATKIPTKPFMIRMRQATKAKAGLIAGFLLVAMALSYGYYRYSHQRPEIPSGTMVLVTDIATSDPALSGITVALKSQLAQSAHFEVEEDSKIVEVLKQMNRKPGDPMDIPTAREIAWRSGVPLFVSGSLSELAQGYALSVEVERVRHSAIYPAARWQRTFLAKDKTEVLRDVVHDAASWIRTLVGEREADLARQDRPVEDTTTTSWQALQVYSDAEKKYSAGDPDTARLLLGEAIQFDPDFAKAHMRLADILISQKQYAEGYREWKIAFDLVAKRKLTNRESFRLQGQYYEDSGNYKAAEGKFAEYKTHYPNDYLAWFYWGSVLDSMGREEEALTAISESERRAPAAYQPVAYEARLDLVLGKFDDAARAIERLRGMQRDGAADSIEVGMDMLQEKFPAALSVLNQLQRSQDTFYESKSYSLRAAFLRELGNDRAAIETLKKGIAFDHARGLPFRETDKWIALAYIYWKNGDAGSCRSASQQALTLERGPLHVLQAGTLLARSGFVEEAKEALKGLPVDAGVQGFGQAWHQLQGEILAAQHRGNDALREMSQASALDASATPREYLARVLDATGRHAEALGIYREITASPARVWQAPDYQYPGFWSDIARAYLAMESDHNDPVFISSAERKARLAHVVLTPE
jgi:serine/threonine protein kinase/tetratricopeptide (TPR) repeat protein